MLKRKVNSLNVGPCMFKANGYTCKGRNFVIFILHLFSLRPTQKVVCFEANSALRINHLRGLHHQWSKKLSPFEKLSEEMNHMSY